MDPESLDQMQARHRRELKDLQGRITSKKKNASKKTRKGVNDECAEMERVLRERQAGEVAALEGHGGSGSDEAEGSRAEDMTPVEMDGEEGQEKEGKQEQVPSSQEAPPGESSSSSSSPGGQPRKRNRQKERLARRAAEQAAMAQKAHDEASTMTDHGARERSSLRKVFEANGLVEREIAPDGHCLFSAVADQLLAHGVSVTDAAAPGTAPDAPAYKVVRGAAAKYIEENADTLAGFVEGDLGAYVARIRDTAEWGGQLELMALAGRYGVEIRVVQDGDRVERIGEAEGRPVLWLAYYRFGFGLGEHYNSLRKGG